jgi:hypothetical protein
MRVLTLAGMTLLAAIVCLEVRRRSRLRARPQPVHAATERWEDEGGAPRGGRGG